MKGKRFPVIGGRKGRDSSQGGWSDGGANSAGGPPPNAAGGSSQMFDWTKIQAAQGWNKGAGDGGNTAGWGGKNGGMRISLIEIRRTNLFSNTYN